MVAAWEEIISKNRSRISLYSEKRRVVSETVSSPQKQVLKDLVAEEKNKRKKRVVSLQIPLPSMTRQLKSWRSASNLRDTEEGVGVGESGDRGRERQAKAGNVKAVSMNSRTHMVGFGYEKYIRPIPMPIPLPMPLPASKPGNKNRDNSSRRGGGMREPEESSRKGAGIREPDESNRGGRGVREPEESSGMGGIREPEERSRRGRRIREPEESWLDLDDSPTSTIGRATPVDTLSTMAMASPWPSSPLPPVTPPPPTEGSEALKTLLQTHLTTALLSLEIDIAQLDTRLFLIFDRLRTVHTSLLLRIPGVTMTPSQTSPGPTTLKQISTTEAKSKLNTLRAELAALGVQMTGYMETVSVVDMQIVEAVGEEDVPANVMEDLMMGVGELRRQVKTVKDELGRLERKRSGLEQWAGEVWVGWNFGAGEEGEEEGKAQVPVLMAEATQSAPVTPVSVPSYLTVPERSDVGFCRNRSIRGSRSMGSIKVNASSSASCSAPPSSGYPNAATKRKPAPPNVNKPLPASPGDGDFEMETRYIRERSRSRSPAPPPLDHSTQPAWGEQLEPPPTSPRAPTIPERNPRRIIPRTGPPPEPQPEAGSALTSSTHAHMPPQTASAEVAAMISQPEVGVNGRRYSTSVTDSTRFSLDLTNLDQLITSSKHRSPADVYQDFFSTHSVISQDCGSYRSQYSRDEDEALRQEWGNEGEEDEEGEFELPPLLPSIGPDSVFSSTNHTNHKKHNSQASIASSCDNSSAPTTPGSASPATPYTPFTPFTPESTFMPYVNHQKRCSYNTYRKPISPPQAPPPSTTQVTQSPTAIPIPIIPTSQQPPREEKFIFYSPSSFPQPPALQDLERKVRRENTLRTTAGRGAAWPDSNAQWHGGEYAYAYPDMDIELLQCPPRGLGYSVAVPQPGLTPAPVALGSTPEKVGVWKRLGMKGVREREEGGHNQFGEWEDGSAGVAVGGGKEGKEGKRWSAKGMGMGKSAFWRIRGGSKDLAKEARTVKMFI